MILGVPSPPLQQILREGRVFLLGGSPPLPLLVRGSPPRPLLQALRTERTLILGGYPPPSSVPWLCAGGARCLVGVPPSIPWLRK